MFAAGPNLAAATLNVTAYQVTAGGPKIVGIAGSGGGGDQNAPANTASLGFGVQVANAPMPPANTTLHWVQVVADNYPATGAPGNQVYGNTEDVVDINSSNKTPYYDQGGGEIATANTLNFFDAPQRDNASETNQSDWWLAQLFLAYGPANNAPGQVTLYNTGVEWGWANFHINVAGAVNVIQALRNAFAFDTSSMTNFDLALNCDPADCPLNAFVTTASLDQLYADFLAAPVPELQTWAMMLLGFAGLGLGGLSAAAQARRWSERHKSASPIKKAPRHSTAGQRRSRGWGAIPRHPTRICTRVASPVKENGPESRPSKIAPAPLS
jgi:hypothetical protein